MLAAQFRHWAGLVDEAMLLVDMSGRIVEANAAASALMRRSRSLLLRTPFHHLVVDPQDKLAEFLRLGSRSRQFIPGAVNLQVAATILHCRIDAAVSTPDAGQEPVLILRLREKHAVGTGFQLLDRDLHIERLAQEIERRTRAQAALHHEHERFQVTLSSIVDGVIASDPRGQITFMNASAERLTGWDRASTVGMPVDRVFCLVCEATQEHMPSPIERALESNAVVEVDKQTLLVDRRGAARAVTACAAPIRSELGDVLGVVLVVRDVTEQRAAQRALALSHESLELRVAERTRELERANHELTQQQAKLVAANAELAQFAYVAAHDLQEPLRMIVSFQQLIQKRVGSLLDETSHGYFAYASNGALRLQEMISSILEYGTIGNEDHPRAPVDLNTVLQKTIDNLQVRIVQNTAEISHNTLPTVVGIESQLIRLFQNLLANAIKFRTAAPPTVRITALQEPEQWMIAISDNGIGIPVEHSDRLFRIFQRLHPHERYPGVGIGLASCKKIVEQHGGRIWFEQRPTGGTSFKFTLPDQRSLR